MNFSSKYIQQAVEAFSSLPGIGKKTALRLVLHVMKTDQAKVLEFTERIRNARTLVKECQVCHNLADEVICTICSDPRRQKELICVVESIRDVMAIEDTGQYQGLYHVLGGVISPIDGIGPQDINLSSLLQRLNPSGDIKEVIMAINPTIEGETTTYYISKKLKDFGVKVSTIARGVAFGGELEYADEITLGRSIAARMPYHLTEE